MKTTRYISILRGINVSGQKKIKMADLKSLYEKAGFSNVITYIQSGNVVFDSEDTAIDKIRKKIEDAIKAGCGFHVPVDVRTRQAYLDIVKACPYEEAQLEENGTKVLVTFLSAEPAGDKRAELEAVAKEPERLVVQGSVVYLYCPGGYGKSRLSNGFIEARLGLVGSTRNWRTVGRLVGLG